MKLLLVEEGSNDVRDLWNAQTSVWTSWITFAEASAAVRAAVRDRRISRRRAGTSLRSLRAYWRSVVALEVDGSISRRASELALRHGLRGMDALHLASALTTAPARPIVVTWDASLRDAAEAERLTTFGP